MLCMSLARALLQWLAVPDSIPQLSDPGAADDLGIPSQAVLSERFAAALLAITPGRPTEVSSTHSHTARHEDARGHDPALVTGAHLQPDLLAFLMAAAHHPSITRGRARGRPAWRAVRKRLHPPPQQWLSASPEAAVSVLLGPEGVASRVLSSRVAACSALGCCMAEAPEQTYPAVMAALLQHLDRKQHDALTPDDIKIFQTAEGIETFTVAHLSIGDRPWLSVLSY